MVLEAHVVLCVTELDLKKNCPKNVENGAKIVFSWIYLKI